MARPISDTIYKLARSLTHSEYQTLRDDSAKSIHSNVPKGEKPLYLQLVDFLRESTSYDDLAAQTRFEVKNQATWRSLKRDTISRLEQAIDRAKANQTPGVVLAKIPSRVENLIRKGIWQRADETVDKYLMIAVNTEHFEIALRIIKIKGFILSTFYPPEKAKKLLFQLRDTRCLIREKIENIENLNDLWQELTFMAREEFSKNSFRINEILLAPLIVSKSTMSEEAEIVYWKLIRRSYFLLKDTENYLHTLRNGILFFRNHRANPAKILQLIQWITELARFLAGAHSFEELDELKDRLNFLADEVPEYQDRINCALLRVSQFKARASLSDENIRDAIRQFNQLAPIAKQVLDHVEYIKIAFRNSDLLFLIKEYSSSAKWIYSIRAQSKHGGAIRHVTFAWIFYLLVRAEMGDFEILKMEIPATRKFIQKHCPFPSFYYLIIKYIETLVFDTKAEEKAKIATEIIKVYDENPLPKFALFFPFDTWLIASQNKRDFLEEMQANIQRYDSL